MSPSIFTRAALVAGLLASTTSAAFDPSSKKNVAMYWGQGSNQIPLIDVCADPNIDIVNIGFVNQFPQQRGEYPGTNFANACADEYFPDPFDSSKNSKLLSNCAGVEEAINACQASGKKVMLSIGGGYPTNYTLPTPQVAAWFAQFLVGAFGPVTPAWANMPRPFGNAVVDGFDLDLEADSWNVQDPDLLFKNYDVFGNYIKTRTKMLLSGAPQGVVPDARLFDALEKVSFDFIFVQFYNTWEVSAAKAVQDKKNGTPSTFTYTKWTNWIRANAKKNPNCKVYLGLPAGPDGLPTHKDHYVNPEDANDLINQYKGDANFGGVMLWEATVNVNNPTYGQSFGTWIKYALEGTFKNKYHPVTSSSSSMMSTSSTRVSTSSTIVLTSSIRTSSTLVSSTLVSSSLVSSSTPISSSIVSTSSVMSSSSSRPAASSSAPVSSSVPVSSSMPVSSLSSHVVSSSASIISSSVHVTESSSSASVVSSSSIHVIYSSASSSVIVDSSSVSATMDVTSSSSVHVSVPTESSVIASSSVVLSSGYDVSSIAVSSAYPAESSTDVVSSIATVSSLSSDVSSSWIDVPTPSSNSEYPASTAASSLSSASEASSASASSSVVYSDYYSKGSQSMSSSAVYPDMSSSAVVSVSKGIDYPAESSKNNGEYPAVSITGTVYATAPSVTNSPEHSGYSSAPNGTATTVITTTYVDVCPTGLTTITTTYVATVCTVCAKPTGTKEAEVPENWTTSVYVDNTVTLTLTKPIAGPTDVPAYSSSASVAYPADYPTAHMSSGKPAYPAVPEASKGVEYPAVPEASKSAGYPATPEASKPAYPTVPEASKGVEYPSVPEASKPAEYPAVPEASKPAEYPAHPVEPEASKGVEYPAYPEASKGAEYPAHPEESKAVEHPAHSAVPSASKPAQHSAAPEYPSVPVAAEYPKKPVEQEVTSTIHVTLTKVPVPAYTPAPYPSAGPYVPAGPAKNATSAMPTGTGMPTMPYTSSPPEFEGAASRAGVGMMMVVGLVGAILMI